jgi:hypothetical protein
MMNSNYEQIREEFERRWKRHSTLAFPPGVASGSQFGADLVEIDTFAGGCIMAFFIGRGELDAERSRILRAAPQIWKNIFPILSSSLDQKSTDYFSEWLWLMRTALSIRSKDVRKQTVEQPGGPDTRPLNVVREFETSE